MVDRKLTRDDLTARMMATQTRAVAMVDDHAERERAAGKPIPWTPQELQVLDGLLGVQRQIAARTEEPLPSPFKGSVERTRRTIDRVVDGAANALPLLAVGAVVIGGGYLLTR